MKLHWCLLVLGIYLFNGAYSFPTVPEPVKAEGPQKRNNNPFSSIVSRLQESHVLDDNTKSEENHKDSTGEKSSIKSNELSKRDDGPMSQRPQVVEDNEFERQQEKEINERINALGLRTHLNNPARESTAQLGLLASAQQITHTKHKAPEKINTKRKDFSLETEENAEDEKQESEEEDSENESDSEKVSHHHHKPKAKKHGHHQSAKLSKKQLNQIYKFIEIKSKKHHTGSDSGSSKESSVTDEDALISSMLLAPNSEVSEDLKDSVSAKKAQSLLLKWHKHVPYAGLHDLKEMYNKFYEYYFEHYTKHEPERHFYHHYHHHYPHGFTYDPYYLPHDPVLDHEYNHFFDGHFYPYHHHYHHHHHHHHHNLNLLDYISSKTKSKKTDLIGKLLGAQSELFDPDYYQHENLNHHFDHYHNHNHENLYDHHDYHALSAELKELTDYNTLLKQQLNYYSSQGMSAPVSLVNEYNHVNHLITTKTLYLTEHAHYSLYHPSVAHIGPHPGHFYQHHDFHYDSVPTTQYGVELMAHHTTTQLTYPPIQASPVVCNNYPEHNTEGFKSFISVESCTQPSYLSATGIPVFGNGCTFHYVCQLGYQPTVTGISPAGPGLGNIPTIKCINGFWSARAICIKKGVETKEFSPKNGMLESVQQNLNQISLIKRTDPMFYNNRAGQLKSLNRFRRSAVEDGEQQERDVIEEESHYEENGDYDDASRDDIVEDPSGADYDTINVDWESVNNKTTALKKSDDSVTGDLNLGGEDSGAMYDKDIDWEVKGKTSDPSASDTTTRTPEEATRALITEDTTMAITTGTTTEAETTLPASNRVTRQQVMTTTEAVISEPSTNDSDKTIYESFYALVDKDNNNDDDEGKDNM